MKKIALLSVLLLILVISGCGQKLIDDGNGHKQFKDSNGNFVKNDWVEISGKKYFFDMNGYLVTNQWVQDEYYVDDKGVMQTNYWYDDKNGKMYYLEKDGKYAKDTIKIIDNNEYAFNKNGELVKNAPYVLNGVGCYFGNDGKVDKTEGYKNTNGTYCYVKDDGALLLNDWKEDEGKWYYFDGNGLMVKNCEMNIDNKVYAFNSEGIGNEKKIKVINFIALKNKYCNYEYMTPDGKIENLGPAREKNAKATQTTLELFGKGSMEIMIMKLWIENINNELGIPKTLYRQILNTAAIDGIQKEKYGNIIVTWYVEITSGNAGGYGREKCLSVFYELV